MRWGGGEGNADRGGVDSENKGGGHFLCGERLLSPLLNTSGCGAGDNRINQTFGFGLGCVFVMGFIMSIRLIGCTVGLYFLRRVCLCRSNSIDVERNGVTEWRRRNCFVLHRAKSNVESSEWTEWTKKMNYFEEGEGESESSSRIERDLWEKRSRAKNELIV